jgi:hypothetical protein
MRSLQASLLALNLLFAIGDAQSRAWNAANFKTLVTFGDSYTDESRLGYFINHNGSAPPVGWEQPVVCDLTLLLIPDRQCQKLLIARAPRESDAACYPRLIVD